MQASFSWRELPPIPANRDAFDPAIPTAAPFWRQIGLAGPVVGIHGDRLLVGGGANFPEPGRLPHEAPALGKVTWDEAFILDLPRGAWLDGAVRLPSAVAYAASVSIADGIVVIGGEGFRGGPNGAARAPVERFADVVLLSLRDGFAATPMAALPHPMTSAVAAAIGRLILVHDGAAAFALDLDASGAGWRALPPFPGPPRQMAVGTAVGETFVVASGRSEGPGGWTLHTDAWAFELSSERWRRLPELPFGVMAGQALALEGGFAIVGGDADKARWDLFATTAAARNAAEPGSAGWTRANDALRFLADHHTGFNSAMPAFDLAAGRWSEIGRFPGAAPVTTTAVLWRGLPIVAGGEVRPGVRTPKVWIGTPA